MNSALSTAGIVGFVTEESLACYCDADNLCNNGTESENRTTEYWEGL